MKKTLLFYIFSLLAIATQLQAQQQEEDTIQCRNWEFKMNAGYNIGGTMPVPFPAQIRKIEKFSPLAWAPHLAIEAIYWFDKHWGISAQIAIDKKGFNVTDSVYQLATKMYDDNAIYEGNFTGMNSNSVENVYVSLPILASFRPSDKWIVQAGFYTAYLISPQFSSTAVDGIFRKGGPTGEKTHVVNSRMDFSDDQSHFDWGLLVAGEWIFLKRLSLRAQFAYGLSSIFPSDFTAIPYSMHNMYATLAVAYSFGKLK